MSDLLVCDQSWPWAIPRRCTIRIRAPPAPHDLISEGEKEKEKPTKREHGKSNRSAQRTSRSSSREVRRQEIERGTGPADVHVTARAGRRRGRRNRAARSPRDDEPLLLLLPLPFSPHTAARRRGSGAHAEQRAMVRIQWLADTRGFSYFWWRLPAEAGRGTKTRV